MKSPRRRSMLIRIGIDYRRGLLWLRKTAPSESGVLHLRHDLKMPGGAGYVAGADADINVCSRTIEQSPGERSTGHWKPATGDLYSFAIRRIGFFPFCIRRSATLRERQLRRAAYPHNYCHSGSRSSTLAGSGPYYVGSERTACAARLCGHYGGNSNAQKDRTAEQIR